MASPCVYLLRRKLSNLPPHSLRVTLRQPSVDFSLTQPLRKLNIRHESQQTWRHVLTAVSGDSPELYCTARLAGSECTSFRGSPESKARQRCPFLRAPTPTRLHRGADPCLKTVSFLTHTRERQNAQSELSLVQAKV